MFKVWEDLLSRIQIEGTVCLCSKTEIDQFELQWKLPIPQSYPAFLRILGPGELFGSRYALISAPLRPAGRNLEGINDCRFTSEAEFYCSDPELFLRGIIFVSEPSGHYCWDPQQMTNPVEHELAIYHIDRSLENVTLVAESFEQFVFDHILDAKDELPNETLTHTPESEWAFWPSGY